MRAARPAIALDPRAFGRGRLFVAETRRDASGTVSELRLFATTFAAGFLFVSILIS